jgi:hypothetical protein
MAALAVIAGSLSACGSIPSGRACGSAHAVKSDAAGRDTIFTRWQTDAKSDSGYNFVAVDAAGDTLSLYLQWVKDVNPHLRIWGPTAGADRSGPRRLWRHHRLEIQDAHEIFESAADVTTQGANSGIRDITLTRLFETSDSISWEQRWEFIKVTGTRDTIGVVRTVLMRKGRPYFLVRYRFAWLGQATDSVRFIWSNHPRMGLDGSRHDVGFAPGFGMVMTQRVFDAEILNWWAGMLDVGNPLAAGVDTLTDGAPSFMSRALTFDSGSGRPDYAAAFVCFNPAADIVPGEFAWMDSTGTGEASLDFDSPGIALDTTNVLDGGFRSFLARTPVLSFSPREVKTLEYAVGRAQINDGLPPTLPDVVWFDGSISRCPVAREEP